MLITKLLPPRYHHVPLPRQRLLDRLTNVAYQQIVYIRAPAGFGKTTLLTQWRKTLIEHGSRVAWINLDASDSDEGQFVDYWVAALKQADFPIQQRLAGAYDRNQPASLENFLVTIINVLAELDDELYLILDDYHCINNPVIDSFLSRLVKHAPANFHLVLSSRTDLPKCLDACRQHSQGNELNVRSLRFSETETHEYLEARMRGTVTAVSSRGLYEATEGWISGIQMLALANELKSPDFSDWSKGLYPLAETILETTLSSVPKETQDILLRLSVLERFNVELCEEVLGVKNAKQMLDEMSVDGLLLVPFDYDERWFRFHALFRERLHQRLARRVVDSLGELHQRALRWLEAEGQQDHRDLSSFLRECKSELNSVDLPSLHYKASLWFERKGLLVEAVQHALASEGEERAYDLIDRCILNLLAGGELNTILAWTDKIPKVELDRRWRLRAARFWAMVLGGLNLSNARQALEELSISAGMEGGISVFEYQVCLSTFEALNGNSLPVLQHINQHPISSDHFHNGVACNALIYALASSSQYDDVPNILAHYPEPPPNVTRGFTYAYRQSILGWVQFLKGNLPRACTVLSEAIKRLDDTYGRRSAPSCVVSGYLAEVLYESNELGTLKSLLGGRLDVMNERVFFESYIRAFITGARLCYLENDDDTAHELLERLLIFGRSTGLQRPVAAALAERIRLLLASGNLERAERLQEELDQLAIAYPPPVSPATMGSTFEIPALAILSRSRVELNKDASEVALKYLEVLKPITAEIRLDYFVKCRLLVGLAMYKINNPDWQDVMLDLLETSSRTHLIRCICDEGPEISKMLQRLLESMPAHALSPYIEKVLLGFARLNTSSALPHQPAYGLSARELDILDLLVQGMPNKRIALALNISAETVKWHLKKIFVKLSVSDRLHAVDKARREKLVGQGSPA